MGTGNSLAEPAGKAAEKLRGVTLSTLSAAPLPPKVVRTAQRVLHRIAAGTPYWQLGGKRLDLDRRLISIPLGRRYRLLCQMQAGQLTPQRILSHAQYNAPHHWPQGGGV